MCQHMKASFRFQQYINQGFIVNVSLICMYFLVKDCTE